MYVCAYVSVVCVCKCVHACGCIMCVFMCLCVVLRVYAYVCMSM